MTFAAGLRILLVEDNPGDVRLVRDLLWEEGTAVSELRQAELLSQALSWLEGTSFDIVLLDLTLPDSRGIETFWRARATARDLPIVVLSGQDDERLAVSAVQAGAQDYLVKGRLAAGLLSQAIRHAIERNRAENRLKAAEARYRSLFEEAPVMYVITRNEGGDAVVTDCNRRFIEALGRDRADIVSQPLRKFYALPEPDEARQETRLLARDGRIIEALVASVPERGENNLSSGSRVTFVDVTEQKQTVRALEESEAKNRALIDAIPDLILRIRPDGTFFEVKVPKEFIPTVVNEGSSGKSVYDALPYGLAQSTSLAARLALESGEIQVMDYEIPEAHQVRHLEARLVPCGGEALAIVRDVTARRELEEQLRQCQKMEAVGRLAGGLAHDFNNMLTAIAGYSELLLTDLPPDDPRYADVSEIKKSADRAADLTRQLLAFSRMQVLKPLLVDPNRILNDMMKLLRRLIAENIELKIRFDPALGTIRADPAQLEQIILNLALNARDAMPKGGTLLIETKAIDLDEAYAAVHRSVKAGSYSMLAVSDTGEGIARELQSKIFEPFFTTKAAGSGTGLGLATVYGIVKQSGGFIWVYSERGYGTTFKVYLPRIEAEEIALLEPEQARRAPRRRSSSEPSETILLVEDDDAVRSLAHRVLREQGYTVVEARDGSEGIRICEENLGSIKLVLTDVVMPNGSGPEIAEKLHRLDPRMKLLFMSGYTENGMVMDTVSSGAPFLQKPFSASGLVQKVREVLNA